MAIVHSQVGRFYQSAGRNNVKVKGIIKKNKDCSFLYQQLLYCLLEGCCGICTTEPKYLGFTSKFGPVATGQLEIEVSTASTTSVLVVECVFPQSGEWPSLLE